MSKFIKRIFTPSMSAQRRQAAETSSTAAANRKTDQEAAQARQLQAEGQARAETESQISTARRAGRGRRLLMAATGEQGVRPSTLGG